MMSDPVITAFENSPDSGQGLARDTRIRWALEEVDLPYTVRPVSFTEMKEAAHRKLHPFGQIPTFEHGSLTLFETGGIVLHLARSYPGLLPGEANARARAITWMFAAVSTIEPSIVDRDVVLYLERDKPWSDGRLAMVEDRIRAKLTDLSRALGEQKWLDGEFSAGDLMVADVLRRLAGSGLLEEFPLLAEYVRRAEARPAFQRAFAAQLAYFQAGANGL